VLVTASAAALAALPLAAQQPPSIPQPPSIQIRAGLTMVGAIAMTTGDAEMITRVEEVNAEGVRITYSGQFLTSRNDDPLSALLGGGSEATGKPELGRIRGVRTVRAADLESARHWQSQFANEQPNVFPGTTSFNLSTLVFDELKTRGQAEFSCSCAPGAPGALGGLASVFGEALGSSPDGNPLAAFAKLSGTLRRVEPKPVPFPVIVNDVRTTLPTIHAQGRLGTEDAELYILDDPQNRLILSARVGPQTSRTVKISFPTEAPRIAAELAKAGRVDVHGIYFDFASAALRPESEPVLQEIADALTENAGWKLRVEGHTDSIGGDAVNLDLSRRRAASVRDALVSRYKIDPTRLATDGFGASRPKEPNTTPAGRARNRRVELVRQ
jgi:outer membrane protein OmpA-like peptidoglycan-associated protein